MRSILRIHVVRFVLIGLAATWLSGCATNRAPIQLPYAFPAASTSPATTAPDAEIVTVRDTREDRSLDMFLNERAGDFLRRVVAAELQAGQAFHRVAAQRADPSQAACQIDLELRDVSWAVPNHAAMVKTVFWTSFLTGGLGGLAYGSTDTPVFGHAALTILITERATSRVLFNEKVEAVHEEKIAKLKSDSLETRARVMAAAPKGRAHQGERGDHQGTHRGGHAPSGPSSRGLVTT